MRLNYVVIRFISPFHIGKSGLGDAYDHVPSDTIYSAFDWLKYMGYDIKISKVSSAFPIIELNGKKELPAPIPVNKLESLLNKAFFMAYGEHRVRAIKILKKVRFIPFKCLWGNLDINMDKSSIALVCGNEPIYEYGKKEFKYGDYIVITKNVMSRNIQNADLYRIVAFQPVTNYVIYFEGEDYRDFELLGQLGLGGKRSSGLGKFEVISHGVVDIPNGGRQALLMGVGLLDNPRGYLNWGVKSWNCSNALIGPVSVLLEGSVLEVTGDIDFKNIEVSGCTKRLSPVVVWLQ